MNSSPINRSIRMLGLCCCALAACHRTPEPAQTPVAPSTKMAKSSASSSQDDPLAGMNRAVAADTRQQSFELRFELASRPEVGKAVDLKLNLAAIDPAAEVKLSVTTMPQLAVIDGADASFANIKAGESVSHTVVLRGTENGIFIVDIKVMATVNGGPRTVNYAVPVAWLPASSAAADAETAPAGAATK